jgi:hypothetical protein
MNIFEYRPISISRLHHDRFVSSTKKMPPQPMPRIDPPRVGILKPPHTRREIRLRSFQEQMVVITHQRIRMNPEPRPLANLSQRSQKGLPVFVIENNITSPITPRHYMIKGPSILDSNLSWHDAREAQSRDHVKN